MIGGNFLSFFVVFLTYVVTIFFLAPPAAARWGDEREHPAPLQETTSPALLQVTKTFVPLYSHDRDAL